MHGYCFAVFLLFFACPSVVAALFHAATFLHLRCSVRLKNTRSLQKMESYVLWRLTDTKSKQNPHLESESSVSGFPFLQVSIMDLLQFSLPVLCRVFRICCFFCLFPVGFQSSLLSRFPLWVSYFPHRLAIVFFVCLTFLAGKAGKLPFKFSVPSKSPLLGPSIVKIFAKCWRGLQNRKFGSLSTQ